MLRFCLRSATSTIKRKVSTGQNEGTVGKIIREKLQNQFQPLVLDVTCESHMHNVPKGSEKHFRVLIVSDNFGDLPLVQRHRLVNSALKEELKGPVHALAIDAFSSEEFSKKTAEKRKSPPCAGGAGL